MTETHTPPSHQQENMNKKLDYNVISLIDIHLAHNFLIYEQQSGASKRVISVRDLIDSV